MIERPKTLHRVATLTSKGGDYSSLIKSYLDELALMKPDEAMASIQTEPGLIKDQIHNTHIAGLAEYIAFINEARAPEWTNDQARFLKDPVFFGGKHSRGHILAKTTFSMRRRNLFCGEIILPTFKRKE